VLQWWNTYKDNKNVLFLFYEGMKTVGVTLFSGSLSSESEFTTTILSSLNIPNVS